MEVLRTAVLTLPGGFVKDGQVTYEVEIREFTGEIELLVNDRSARNNAEFAAKVLQLCLVRVGPEEPVGGTVPIQTIRNMLAGDVEYCLVQARKLSLGDQVQGQMQCGLCNAVLDIELSLDSIKVQELAAEDREQLVKEQLAFHVKDVPLGIDATFRYPLYADTIALASVQKTEPGKVRHQMFANCCLQWGEEEMPVKASFFSKMPWSKLGHIEDAFLDKQPGLALSEQEVRCAECGAYTTLDLNQSDFFFQRRRHRQKT